MFSFLEVVYHKKVNNNATKSEYKYYMIRSENSLGCRSLPSLMRAILIAMPVIC